jgi:V-type H+-transporting ATPase subunit C
MSKDFLRSYETLAPMVVPRSSIRITSDDEYTLFAVTTFKKHGQEFIHKCREKKWTPRDYKYVEGGQEEEQKELERVTKEKRKLWGEALRLGRTGWSEGAMVWVHILALRTFVETVLRYGLPLDFVCGIVKVGDRIELPPYPPLHMYMLISSSLPDNPQTCQEGKICS